MAGIEARYMSVAIGLTALRIPSAATSATRSLSPERRRRERTGSSGGGELTRGPSAGVCRAGAGRDSCYRRRDGDKDHDVERDDATDDERADDERADDGDNDRDGTTTWATTGTMAL
jgi:hypothetical protein